MTYLFELNTKDLVDAKNYYNSFLHESGRHLQYLSNNINAISLNLKENNITKLHIPGILVCTKNQNIS